MDTTKYNIIEQLDSLKRELLYEGCDFLKIEVITNAIRYIQDMPCIRKKSEIVQAIACNNCRNCAMQFSFYNKKCMEEYVRAENFYNNYILVGVDN